MQEELHSAKKLSARYLVVSQEASSSHPLEVPRAYSLAALVTSSALLRKYRCLKCMESLRLQERTKYQAVQAGDIHYNLAVLCLFEGCGFSHPRYVHCHLKPNVYGDHFI